MKRVVLALLAGLAVTGELSAVEATDAGQPLALALKSTVQKELKLTADQAAEAKKLYDRAAKEAKAGEAALAELAKNLKPAQLQRLKEISLQVRGGSALVDAEVQKGLNLSRTQSRKIQDIWRNAELDLRMKLSVARFKSPTDRRWYIMRARRDTGNQMLEELDDGQKKKFEAMQGTAFPTKGLDR